jgi:LysR family transcriptional regulator (chromosome initiation inhibitor)
MYDYAALAALAAVVEEGSFERAARRLHVTPSAVSQRIRALEERVGCALVVRAQPCSATEAGRRLCQHVDRVRLLEHELALDQPALATGAGGAATPSRVRVPIAVNADSLASWFEPVLAAAAELPGLLLDLAVDNEDQTSGWLRRGEVLAAVSAHAGAVPGCNSRALGALRYVAAASPAFAARHFARGVDAGSLREAPCLRFNAQDDLQQRWVRRLCRREVQLPCHRIPAPQSFVAAARAGLGWGLHPRMLIERHLTDGSLVELLPDAPLDVPLYWQQARVAGPVLAPLAAAVMQAARCGLLAPHGRRPAAASGQRG